MPAGNPWPIDIQRIVRVNQSGEYGAVGIYQAQIIFAHLAWRDGALLLRDMLSHEREHLALFSSLLKRRGIRSCYALPLWRLGGWVLGTIACLFGRHGILVCTTAVETTVLRHFDEQRKAIGDRDSELLETIALIEHQEREHRDHGVAATSRAGFVTWFIGSLASVSTHFAIWLSMRL